MLKLSLEKHIDEGHIAYAAKSILLACAEGLQIPRASMWRFRPDRIECILLVDNNELFFNPSIDLLRVDFPAYFKALDQERVVIASDAENHEATFEFKDSYLKPLGIKSMLDMPIRFKGQMYGLICCENKGQIKEWQDDEIVFLSSIAEICGRAISANFRHEYEVVLKAINENLEEVVADRTKELEAMVKDLKEAQSQLVESEKMAALGNLVSGVAHEVNTPLGIAITSVSAIEEAISDVSFKLNNKTLTQNDLDQMLASTNKAAQLAQSNLYTAANLISDFKLVAADQAQVLLTSINLQEYLNQVINTLKPQLAKNDIQFDFNPQENIELTTFPGLIAQTVTNIIQNCVHHAFLDNHIEPKKIDLGLYAQENKCFISVKDNGLGMTGVEQSKIFEPFYTTKRGAGQKGLGLAIAFNAVNKQLNGQLTVKSKVGKGTEFIIELPLKVVHTDTDTDTKMPS